MERVKRLNYFQKGVLILMIVMAIAFAAAYYVTVSRVGFEYRGAILVRTQEGGDTVYSGKIKGQEARFTVSGDKTVVFQCGERTFGPYTAREDPTAIPESIEIGDMVGVEVYEGDSLMFRGGVLDTGDGYYLYKEDGTPEGFGVFFAEGEGVEIEDEGPSVTTIISLMDGPELTHNGDWSAWFWAVVLCALDALLMLFADEIFRWQMRFRIRDVEDAEPSEWEIAGRYAAWTLLAFTALLVFIAGLM